MTEGPARSVVLDRHPSPGVGGDNNLAQPHPPGGVHHHPLDRNTEVIGGCPQRQGRVQQSIVSQQQRLPAQGAVDLVWKHIDVAKSPGLLFQPCHRRGQQTAGHDRRVLLQPLPLLDTGQGRRLQKLIRCRLRGLALKVEGNRQQYAAGLFDGPGKGGITGLRLREDGVKSDHRCLCLFQPFHQAGQDGARPGPASQPRQALLVDGGNHDAIGRRNRPPQLKAQVVQLGLNQGKGGRGTQQQQAEQQGNGRADGDADQF